MRGLALLGCPRTPDVVRQSVDELVMTVIFTKYHKMANFLGPQITKTKHAELVLYAYVVSILD